MTVALDISLDNGKTYEKIISLILSVSIITNTLSWAYYVTLINMVLTPRVYAANEIYESLENTFDLSNPAANRTATVTTDNILEKYKSSEGVHTLRN